MVMYVVLGRVLNEGFVDVVFEVIGYSLSLMLKGCMFGLFFVLSL